MIVRIIMLLAVLIGLLVIGAVVVTVVGAEPRSLAHTEPPERFKEDVPEHCKIAWFDTFDVNIGIRNKMDVREVICLSEKYVTVRVERRFYEEFETDTGYNERFVIPWSSLATHMIQGDKLTPMWNRDPSLEEATPY